MAGVLRRTALVDNSKGYPIYHDYCLVETSIGTLIEWNPPFQRGELGTFSPSNENYKVDDIVSLSIDVRPDVFKSSDGRLLHEISSPERTGY